MALIWCDSWDAYTVYSTKWTAYGGVTGTALNATAARTGPRGFQVRHDVNNPATFGRLLGANYTELYCGFAFKHDGGSTGLWTFFQFFELGSNVLHCSLALSATNILYVGHGGTGGVVGSPSSFTVQPNVSYYIEVHVVIHDTTGVVQVKVDGNVVLSATGVDTRNAGTGVIDQIRLSNNGRNSNHAFFDDMVIMSTAGSAMNGYIGDVKIECLSPSGNGATSQFVGNDANSTDNYLLVDEIPANGDTDYVQSNVVGDKDTYAFGDLTTVAGTVHGLQINSYARKIDAGPRTLALIARTSGGTEEDSAGYTLSTSYQYFADTRTTKPGGGAWSISEVNGAQFGVKVAS